MTPGNKKVYNEMGCNYTLKTLFVLGQLSRVECKLVYIFKMGSELSYF